jgi:c-di-GMP-binding flagellar brake protein YcgR
MSRAFRIGGERRDTQRVPLEIFMTEYVDENPHRALTTNLSPTGIYVHRVQRPRWFLRDDRFVQLEFALPGTTDTIWARGQIRYDELGLPELVHGTGIQFVDLARGHRRLICDFVMERQKQRVREVLTLMRRRRYH